jgi:hypothetical protein
MRISLLFAAGLLLGAGLGPARAAETPEEQNACFLDAQRVCPGTIPNRELVFNCLVRNRPALSRICRTAIEREVRNPPASPRS